MNKDKARLYYNALASRYDQATEKFWTAPDTVETTTMHLSDKDKFILDIGIGTGQSIQKLYTSQNFKIIEGIDVAEDMLKYCSQHFPGIILHHGDFLDPLKLQQSDYDLIISCGTLEFIKNVDLFFEKCKKLLAHNGHIVITFEPHIMYHSVQDALISEVPYNASIGVAGLQTYRHDLATLQSIFERCSLKIINSTLFVAYRKGETEIIYNLLHLRHA